jgi:hypothetical protein
MQKQNFLRVKGVINRTWLQTGALQGQNVEYKNKYQWDGFLVRFFVGNGNGYGWNSLLTRQSNRSQLLEERKAKNL